MAGAECRREVRVVHCVHTRSAVRLVVTVGLATHFGPAGDVAIAGLHHFLLLLVVHVFHRRPLRPSVWGWLCMGVCRVASFAVVVVGRPCLPSPPTETQ